MYKASTITSKLPNVGTTIFSVMSALAKEYNAVNLSQGFPDFAPDEKLREAVAKALESNCHQYALMFGSLLLREKIAAKYAAHSKVLLHPDSEITITAGATQAIFTAIQAVVQPGDEVLLFAPCYDSYVPAITLAGGKCIFYNMLPPHFSINWSEVAQLISPKTKLIVFNSPHNPTASLLTAEDIVELKQLLAHTPALLLSDEVYEHIVFDGKQHQSFLCDETLRARSFVVSSFGKTYHVTGWKVGYCIAPEALTKEFRKVHQFNVFSVNSMAQEVFSQLLDFPDLYTNLSLFYEEKRNTFRALLQASAFDLLPCGGTYFQLASYAKISEANDVEFCRWLTCNIGVAAIPVSVFYEVKDMDVRLVRFCFAKRQETLLLASERLNSI